MGLYTYEDENTGLKVQAESDNPLSGEDVDWLFGAAQKDAQKKLSDGSFKFDSEGVNELGKDEQRQQVRRLAAQALGSSEDDIDIDSGMGMWDRTKLSFQPTDADKMKQLEDTYGKENVNMLDVGGTQKMFYRDPKTKKMTMVDEMGASFADFTADIAGTALPVAGAIGAAVATGGASIPVMALAAAAGGFAASAGQDVAVRAASGEDIRGGEIAKRRGIEAAIGVPIDLVTGGVGKFFARRIAGRAASSLVDEVDGAIASVNKQLKKMEASALPEVQALRTGAGSKQASEIAAQRPTSKLAVELQGVRDKLSEYKELVAGRGRAGASTDDFNRVSEEVGNTYRGLVDEIGKIDKGLAKELEGQASRKLRQMSAPRVSESEVGAKLQQILKRAEGEAGIINDTKFAELDQMARELGVSVSGKDIARSIRETVDSMKPLENKALDQLAKDLEAVGKMSFTDLRRWISRIQDSVPDSQAGFKTAQQVSIAASKNVRALRDRVANKAGDAFESKYNDTMDYYLNDYLNFKRQSVGGALKEISGAVTQPEMAARALISNRSSVKAALRAARQGGEGEEAALRSELKDLYLNRVGLIGNVDPKAMNLQINDDIVEELWGRSKVKEMHNLQKRLVQSKINTAELTKENLDEYLSAMTGDERKRIFNEIVKRGRISKKLAKQKNAVLLRKMQPKYDKQTGTWLEPEVSGMSLAKFSEGFIEADTTQVIRAMKLMEAQGDDLGIQAFRQSYIGNLLDGYSGGAQIDSFGNPLWNPKALEQAMRPGTKLRNNMDAILGKDGALEILDANRVLLEAAESGGSSVQQAFQPRYSLTSGGLQLYGVGNVMGSLRGKALAWAYGSKSGAKLMRFLTNKGDDVATEKMLQKLLPALMTSSGGMKAAAIQGQFDPGFTEQIAPLFNDGQVEAGQ
jgi:hypothetical protein